MQHGFRHLRLQAAGIVLVTLTVACGSSGAAEHEWGGEAVEYFDELAGAYAANDYYEVLDFYATGAFQERWRGAIRGGLLVRDLLVWNSGDLGHEIMGVYLGSKGALVLLRWETAGGLSVVLRAMENGVIADETVYDHSAWMGAALRTSPEVVSSYRAVYEQRQQTLGQEDGGVESVEELELMQTVNTVDVSGPAMFLGPADFGVDPGRAAAVYNVTDDEGCRYRSAFVWRVENGRIVEENRYDEVASFSQCGGDDLPDGWWDGLDLPLSRDEVVSGVLRTPRGHELSVHNGTPRLEAALIGGFERFGLAGLAEPRFDAVTFEPSRRCVDRSGRLLQDENSRSLYLCMFESDLCLSGPSCNVPSLIARSSVLHELAHAWILDHVDEATQDRLLQVTGRETWQDDGVPWPERGVEYAAEVLTWGLLRESVSMVRIGSPPCEELHSSFGLLTGVEPLRASDCTS